MDAHAREIIRMWVGSRKPGGHSPISWPLTSADDQLEDIDHDQEYQPDGTPLGSGPAPVLWLGLGGPRPRPADGAQLHDPRWPVEGKEWLVQRLRGVPAMHR
jgi:hypothetical protein